MRRPPPSHRERARGRARKRNPFTLRLGPEQLACIDAIRADLRAAGAPPFSRRQIALAMLSATLGRRFSFANVRTLEHLKVALGALDLSDVEKRLRERPRIESNVLDALEDTIK